MKNVISYKIVKYLKGIDPVWEVFTASTQWWDYRGDLQFSIQVCISCSNCTFCSYLWAVICHFHRLPPPPQRGDWCKLPVLYSNIISLHYLHSSSTLCSFFNYMTDTLYCSMWHLSPSWALLSTHHLSLLPCLQPTLSPHTWHMTVTHATPPLVFTIPPSTASCYFHGKFSVWYTCSWILFCSKLMLCMYEYRYIRVCGITVLKFPLAIVLTPTLYSSLQKSCCSHSTFNCYY